MTYKLLWITDPHLNFCHEERIRSLCDKIRSNEPNAVVITGDISEAPELINHLAFMDMNLPDMPIFFVCGNHDYYRGSIKEVRKELSKLFTYKKEDKITKAPKLGWLYSSGVIPLTENSALIGADGWYDGGYANWFTSNIDMADYELIAEIGYMCHDKYSRFEKINHLSQESALYVGYHAREAVKDFDHIYIATHVAPFPENAVYNGKISDDRWMPHFSSKYMGDTLKRLAECHPEKKFTVLCGHSHGKAYNSIMPNLDCLTGKARYKHPEVNEVFNVD